MNGIVINVCFFLKKKLNYKNNVIQKMYTDIENKKQQ